MKTRIFFFVFILFSGIPLGQEIGLKGLSLRVNQVRRVFNDPRLSGNEMRLEVFYQIANGKNDAFNTEALTVTLVDDWAKRHKPIEKEALFINSGQEDEMKTVYVLPRILADHNFTSVLDVQGNRIEMELFIPPSFKDYAQFFLVLLISTGLFIGRLMISFPVLERVSLSLVSR